LNFDRVDIISFEDENSVSFPVRDIKPLGDYQTGIFVDVLEGAFLDDIISRTIYYGDGSEDLSYQIVEHNKVAFAEALFNLDKIKNIDIPIVNED